MKRKRKAQSYSVKWQCDQMSIRRPLRYAQLLKLGPNSPSRPFTTMVIEEWEQVEKRGREHISILLLISLPYDPRSGYADWNHPQCGGGSVCIG